MRHQRWLILALTHFLCLLCGVALAVLARTVLFIRHRPLSNTEACAAIDGIVRPVEKAICIYTAKHKRAPDDLSQLVAEGLLPALPRNPFYDRPAYNVRLDAQHRQGDYSYLTGNTMYTETGKVVATARDTYWLLWYGREGSATQASNESSSIRSLEQATGRSFSDVVVNTGTRGMEKYFGQQPVQMNTGYATPDELLHDYGYRP